jgi:hypothetical protein
MRFFKYICVLFLSFSSFCACTDNSIVKPVVGSTDYKVLFVGNSFTFYNEGVDFHLQQMLNKDGTSDSINYTIQRIAVSSYTLQAHYGDTLTINKIRKNNWNVVILQEQSTRPLNNPDLFLEYAQKLDVEIKKINAKTVLYMTWAPKDSPTDMVALNSSYLSVGLRINAKVAPVGQVWESVQKSNPLINFYFSDNKHPSLAGTYLISCVFYYSLFNKNPVNNTYIPTGISTQNASAIRKGVYDFMIQYQ